MLFCGGGEQDQGRHIGKGIALTLFLLQNKKLLFMKKYTNT